MRSFFIIMDAFFDGWPWATVVVGEGGRAARRRRAACSVCEPVGRQENEWYVREMGRKGEIVVGKC
jgi:hypothetical protein